MTDNLVTQLEASRQMLLPAMLIEESRPHSQQFLDSTATQFEPLGIDAVASVPSGQCSR